MKRMKVFLCAAVLAAAVSVNASGGEAVKEKVRGRLLDVAAAWQRSWEAPAAENPAPASATETDAAPAGGGLLIGLTDAAPGGSSAQASYTVQVVDQNGDPVPEVYLNFCTDDTCVLTTSDEEGIIRFEGAPEEYHLQFVAVPEGYTYDPEFECYTEAWGGELTLTIEKE